MTTVRELIEALQEFHPDFEVRTAHHGADGKNLTPLVEDWGHGPFVRINDDGDC